MRWALAVTCVLLGSCGSAFSQTVELPSEVKTDVGAPTRIRAKTDGTHVQWFARDSGLMVFPAEQLKDSSTGVVWALKPGRYRIVAYTAKGDVPSPPAECVVVVGDPGPTPGPGPEPDPGPGPTPSPAPIPLPGLRVLIVVETADQSKLPKDQLTILTSTKLRTYLNEKTAKGADGKTGEYRIWDKDVPGLDGEAKHWKDVMARPRAELPWIVISNSPKGGFEGPLPRNVDDTIALIKKFE